MRKYASKEELDRLAGVVKELAERVAELARWQAYYAIRENPYVPPRVRREILEMSRGHITFPLFRELFREHPYPEEVEEGTP